MAPKLTVRFAAGQFGSAGDAAHTVERSSSKAARGCEQLPRALPDAAAAPVLAFEQGAGQPAQGEAPEAITSSRAAAGVSAPSESDPRRATRCVPLLSACCSMCWLVYVWSLAASGWFVGAL